MQRTSETSIGKLLFLAVGVLLVMATASSGMTVELIPAVSGNQITGFSAIVTNSSGYNGTLGYGQQITVVFNPSGLAAGQSYIVASNATISQQYPTAPFPKINKVYTIQNGQSPIVLGPYNETIIPPPAVTKSLQFNSTSFNQTGSVNLLPGVGVNWSVRRYPKINLARNITPSWNSSFTYNNSALGILINVAQMPKGNVNAIAPYSNTITNTLVALPNFNTIETLTYGECYNNTLVGIHICTPPTNSINWTYFQDLWNAENPNAIADCSNLIRKNGTEFCGDNVNQAFLGDVLASRSLDGGIQTWLNNTYRDANNNYYSQINVTKACRANLSATAVILHYCNTTIETQQIASNAIVKSGQNSAQNNNNLYLGAAVVVTVVTVIIIMWKRKRRESNRAYARETGA